MRNIDIIKSFLFGCESCKTKNLQNIKINNKNNVLYNYNAKIAYKGYNIFAKNYFILINKKWLHYSKTTQTNINNIIKLAEREGIEINYEYLND